MQKQRIRYWLALFVLCALVVGLEQTLAAPEATFTVSVGQDGAGTIAISPQKATYALGETVELTATPGTNWTFDSWTGDLNLQNWWDAQFDYRLPLSVTGNGYPRYDKPAELALNFAPILQGLGTSAALDIDSLRLVEVNASGVVVDAQVPFQFDVTSGSAGTLVFMLTGSTTAFTPRQYMLYFDVVGKGFTAVQPPTRVALTDDVDDEGWPSLQIQTFAPGGGAGTTYYYHKNGGGFSSVNDQEGHDWVSWNAAPASAGDYRGIPNMVPPNAGYFHPGRSTATTSIVSQGKLKASFRSTAGSPEWQVLWSVYPSYATMKVEKAPGTYWFLYEGTPGGKLEPATDRVVRSNGTDTPASLKWSEDLSPEEWVYFRDPNLKRALFMAQPQDDVKVDTYRTQNNDPTNEDAAMTVFGFGRLESGTLGQLSGTSHSLAFGLFDTLPAGMTARDVILSAVQPVNVSSGTAQKRQTVQQTTTNPYTFRVNGNHSITAKFLPPVVQDYTLNVVVAPNGGGSVTRDPDLPKYTQGTVVNLEALANPGWRFANWSDGLGNNPRIAVTMDRNRTLTATFAQEEYPLAVEVLGQGTVEVQPARTTYRYGDVLTLTAVPAPGWRFARWGGDLSGSAPSQQLTVTGPVALQVEFNPPQVFLPLIKRSITR